MKDLFEFFKKYQQISNRKSQPVSQPNTLERKCFNKYCHKQGVNLDCDGTQCSKYERKCGTPGANHKPEATYHDCMGDSNKNVHLWGKYQLPGGRIHNDKECTDEFVNFRRRKTITNDVFGGG